MRSLFASEQKKERAAERDMGSSENGLIQLFDKALSVFILFFSRFVYDVLQKFGSRVELIASVILFSALWFVFDSVCRKYVIGVRAIRSNSQWKYVVFGIFDFVGTLLMYLLAQLVLNGLLEVMQVGDLDLAESMTVVFLVILFGTAAFIRVKTLLYVHLDDKEEVESELNAKIQ